MFFIALSLPLKNSTNSRAKIKKIEYTKAHWSIRGKEFLSWQHRRFI
jgi:hypothetical protein